MTEASENAVIGLVRVRAQVMCRDEATGGWMAVAGGGLADILVGKREHPRNGDNGDTSPRPPHEYFIQGKRISDNMHVLECVIKKDFQYNKVMPTFHHWVSDERRFGLTFQTAADARAFDRGVRNAVQDLLHGLGDTWPSYKKMFPSTKEEDEEQNIFECLNLPTDSRSSSETSAASKRRDDFTQTPILCAVTLPSATITSKVPDPLKQFDSYDDKTQDEVEIDRCHYVHLSAVHDYQYPTVASEKSSPNTKPPLLKRDSGSIKKCTTGSPPLPDKKPPERFVARQKCRHCHEWYLESGNGSGACEFSPDCFKACIETVSCITCAKCMLYHCMSDSEGEFPMHPCTCGPPDEACAKRWLGLTLLSLLVPCLCCYAPLRCIHRATASGQHAPHPDT